LAREAPKGAARATRVSEAIVPNRLGKAEEAPRRVWMGEGRNEDGARELAESPNDRTRPLQGAAVTNPLDPRSAKGRGNARAVTKARGASSNALRHEGYFDGLRSAGNPTQIGSQAQLKSTRVSSAPPRRCVQGLHGQVTDPIGCSFEVVGL